MIVRAQSQCCSISASISGEVADSISRSVAVSCSKTLAKTMANLTSTSTVVRLKLSPPSRREPLLARPRLLTKALEHIDRRLILISAPAGYGKTTLLSQIHQSIQTRGQRAAWVSLDQSDNDFVRFVGYLVAALQSTGLPFGDSTAAILKSGISLPIEVLKATLLNEMAAVTTDVYLFLDDYHLVNDEAIVELVRQIVLAPLDRIHLLAATRNGKSLPASRLRMTRLIYEVDSFELEFSERETAEYFRVCAEPLNAEQIALLHQRTEGWIAGLQLASLAVGKTQRPEELLETFSGERRSIGEFLAEEVFRRQPEDIRRFLLSSSILKRFDAATCNTLIGINDSQAMIERIGDANLFLFSLDNDRRWYRYHHLFSEFLQRRLHDDDPAAIPELHRRACEALSTGPFVAEAIEHAFAAGDFDRAGELLDRWSLHLFATGQTSTLRFQANRLPRQKVARLPRLQLELAWEAEIRWEFAAAREALENVRSVLMDSEDNEIQTHLRNQTRLRSELAHRDMMLSVFSDEIGKADLQAREWLERYATDDLFMQASVGTTRILCDRELHVCNVTEHTAHELHLMLVNAGATYGTVFHNSVCGSAFFARGELDAANRIYRQALETAEALHGVGTPLAAMPALLLAELLYERNELDEARAIYEVYARETPQLGFVDNLIASVVIGARLAFLDSDVQRADDILRSGHASAIRFRFSRLSAAILCERSRQAALCGRTSDIPDLIRESGLSHATSSSGGLLSYDTSLLATVSRVTADAESVQATALQLRNLLSRSVRMKGIRTSLLATLRLAIMTHAAERWDDTRHHVMRALRIARDAGFVRTLLDEGQPFVTLLSEFGADEMSGDESLARYARKLMSASANLPRISSQFDWDERPPAGLLSAREIDVLRMGLDSRTNEESAQLLGLTESTVKWYWQRIFDKLCVRRRSEAIRKARAFSLL